VLAAHTIFATVFGVLYNFLDVAGAHMQESKWSVKPPPMTNERDPTLECLRSSPAPAGQPRNPLEHCICALFLSSTISSYSTIIKQCAEHGQSHVLTNQPIGPTLFPPTAQLPTQLGSGQRTVSDVTSEHGAGEEQEDDKYGGMPDNWR
jgi:hypothetical protein